jgi:phage-related protein
VRVFVKKTLKTPRREIDLALERAKEVTDDEPHAR